MILYICCTCGKWLITMPLVSAWAEAIAAAQDKPYIQSCTCGDSMYLVQGVDRLQLLHDTIEPTTDETSAIAEDQVL